MTTLDKLSIGEKALINEINLKQETKYRLFELGFLEGTEISLLHKSPNGKNLAYLIRGTVIGLRDDDAKGISSYTEVN